ncbi:MAG: hypothetical protein ACFFCS_06360, partial [Candidatus Hodarchaeota archaeon]
YPNTIGACFSILNLIRCYLQQNNIKDAEVLYNKYKEVIPEKLTEINSINPEVNIEEDRRKIREIFKILGEEIKKKLKAK